MSNPKFKPNPELVYAEFALETEGINIYTESALHAALKKHLFQTGDRLEVAVGGKIVDLKRATGELVEIQTRRLDRIVSKVLELATHENVVVVHPIAIETTICRTDPSTDEIISIRKSPKHGTVYNLFDEMVRASSLIGAEHVTIDVILVRIREIRTRDGRGSWRRNGDSTVSRELIEVVETRRFESREDWIQLLPQSSLAPEGAWDSLSLAAALGIAPARARKLLYSFRRANILADAGKAGNRKLYRVLPANQSPS